MGFIKLKIYIIIYKNNLQEVFCIILHDFTPSSHYHCWGGWGRYYYCSNFNVKNTETWNFIWCTQDTRGGMGREVAGRFKRDRTYVYLWLIHVDVWQKPPQYCKVIILQFKKIKYTLSLAILGFWKTRNGYNAIVK